MLLNSWTDLVYHVSELMVPLLADETKVAHVWLLYTGPNSNCRIGPNSSGGMHVMPSGLLTIVIEYNEVDQNSGLLIEDAL